MQLSDEEAQELKRLEEDLWRSEVRFSPEKKVHQYLQPNEHEIAFASG